MDISELRLEEESDYAAWLLAQTTSMIYFAPVFHRFLKAAAGGQYVVLIAKRAGKIVGALPYGERRHVGFGTVINSLPWYGSYGGCVLADETDEAARCALVERFAAVVSREGLLTATLTISPKEARYTDAYERILQPRALDERVSQITELPESGHNPELSLDSVLLQKTRNLARKARKQGFIEIITDEDWAWTFLYKTHVENMNAVGGMPKLWEHFSAIRSILPPHMRRLSVAMLDKVPVAAMLLLMFNRTVEYVTPAIVLAHRPRQPLSFLIWQGMRAAMDAGYRFWNWGGTWLSQESLHHFKAGWGAKDTPYRYLVSASDESERLLSARRKEIQAAFPYYYLYPFARLTHDRSQ